MEIRSFRLQQGIGGRPAVRPSPEIGKFGLGVKEVQAAGLRREADLIAAGIEAEAWNAFSERQMLRPHAEHHAAAGIGGQCGRIRRVQTQPLRLDGMAAGPAAHGRFEENRGRRSDEAGDELVGGFAVDLQRRADLLDTDRRA